MHSKGTIGIGAIFLLSCALFATVQSFTPLQTLLIGQLTKAAKSLNDPYILFVTANLNAPLYTIEFLTYKDASNYSSMATYTCPLSQLFAGEADLLNPPIESWTPGFPSILFDICTLGSGRRNAYQESDSFAGNGRGHPTPSPTPAVEGVNCLPKLSDSWICDGSVSLTLDTQ